MEFDALTMYLEKIKGYSERVCFHVMGEPLGHKEFPRFVETAARLKVPLEITTNGTLMSEANQTALLHPIVQQVNFSVQSFFDNFPNADHSTYMEKLIAFAVRASQEHPDLYVNFRLWNLGDPDGNDEKNTRFMDRLEEAFETKINRTVDPGFQKSKKLRGRVYLHFDSRFSWPDQVKAVPEALGTCYGTRTHVAVHADGTVVPCCLDKEAAIRLGSLKTQTLEDILQSPRYVRMREGFEQGRLEEEFCRTCTYARRFNPSKSTRDKAI